MSQKLRVLVKTGLCSESPSWIRTLILISILKEAFKNLFIYSKLVTLLSKNFKILRFYPRVLIKSGLYLRVLIESGLYPKLVFITSFSLVFKSFAQISSFYYQKTKTSQSSDRIRTLSQSPNQIRNLNQNFNFSLFLTTFRNSLICFLRKSKKPESPSSIRTLFSEFQLNQNSVLFQYLSLFTLFLQVLFVCFFRKYQKKSRVLVRSGLCPGVLVQSGVCFEVCCYSHFHLFPFVFKIQIILQSPVNSGLYFRVLIKLGV